MSYEKFAYLYDELMQDVPYENWLEIVNVYAAKNHISGKKLLDLACGTGELSVRLASAGFSVTGADLSTDMLSVAKAKADEWSLPIEFFQQDMTKLDDLGEFDIIGIFCDSLNYLNDEQAVLKTFEGVSRLLKKGGIFLFDVHSLFKIEEIFADATFAWDGEDISYIWNSFRGEAKYSVEHELTFFVLDELSGKYDRVEESHFQRSFPVSFYKGLLEKTGFSQVDVTGDFTLQSPESTAERIFFAAVKK